MTNFSRFQQSLFGEAAPYTEKYSVSPELSITMRCPRKKILDIIITYLDSQDDSRPLQLLRQAETLRIRAYLSQIECRDSSINFQPLDELIGEDGCILDLLDYDLEGSLDFAGEELYNVLRCLADKFKAHIDELSEEICGPEGENDNSQSLSSWVDRKKAEGYLD